LTRFEDVKPSFWREGSTYGVQPPLTDDAVHNAESVLGVTLPDALVELLKVRNGGGVSTEFDAFPTEEPTSWAEEHVPFDDVMGIGERSDSLSLLDTPYLVEEWGLPSPVVLLSGDGHYWVALDYRECDPSGEPAVTWFDTELGTQLPLARDFRSFVEGLRAMDSFQQAPIDVDHPPPEEPGEAALSFTIELIESDIELLEAGSRSLANTKLWCRARVAAPLRRLGATQTASLAAAVDALTASRNEADATAAMRVVQQELEQLIPAWIESGGFGSFVDAESLKKRRATG
jgi:hypothetical protein